MGSLCNMFILLRLNDFIGIFRHGDIVRKCHEWGLSIKCKYGFVVSRNK